MIHYANGIQARVGDAVLLHYRTYTGTVRHVIDTPGEVRAWGLDVPGLMIDTSYAGLVFHPQDDLTADEVELASESPA